MKKVLATVLLIVSIAMLITSCGGNKKYSREFTFENDKDATVATVLLDAVFQELVEYTENHQRISKTELEGILNVAPTPGEELKFKYKIICSNEKVKAYFSEPLIRMTADTLSEVKAEDLEKVTWAYDILQKSIYEALQGYKLEVKRSETE